MIALSIDAGGLPDVERFYDQLDLRGLGIFVDQSGAAMRALRILGVPTTLLVDPAGRELGRSLGPAEWDDPAIVAALRQHVAGSPTRES